MKNLARQVRLLVAILLCGFSIVTFAATSNGSKRPVRNPLAERREYLSIIKIKDPERRIISEQSLSVLGLSDQAGAARAHAMVALRDQIASHPNDTKDFEIFFAKGLSLDELAALITSASFAKVDTVQMKFVEPPLVETVGFRGFNDYVGPPEKVLQFLVYKYRETLRAQVMVEKRAGMDAKGDDAKLARLEDFSKLRFYGMDVEASFRQIGKLLDSHLQDLMKVDYRLIRGPSGRRYGARPLPDFDVNKPLTPTNTPQGGGR